MNRYLVLLSVFLLAVGCTDRDDDLAAANIRIKNVSTFVFDEVQVGVQEDLHMNIAPGAYSEYLPYEVAYRYAYISIKAGEETFVLQPIDYTGETELPVGLYTYELDVTDEGEVSLLFTAD
jgi:hypothetical protein